MIFKDIRDDIDAIRARDPAARSRLEVVLCYPGLHAVVMHRLAHSAWNANLKLLGRFISHVSRWLTGIEIHPAAKIGRRLFVDHGMACVIGETAEVGDDVTLYQGALLGGISLEAGKRHPTLGNGVIVGAGAKILGPVTVGDGARIGSNAVVLKDVSPGSTMVGVPAHPVIRLPAKDRADFCAYGQDPDLPDPVARALDGLCSDVVAMRARIAELENQVAVLRAQSEPEGVAMLGRPEAALELAKGERP
ncbi:MAG: serine O-acetyltransferase [Alphaproteobacteria bacterium]|nr:serine O-acetyltransferase [Alphaproteobacteria bacterium]